MANTTKGPRDKIQNPDCGKLTRITELLGEKNRKKKQREGYLLGYSQVIKTTLCDIKGFVIGLGPDRTGRAG